jgi:hypothetical protein
MTCLLQLCIDVHGFVLQMETMDEAKMNWNIEYFCLNAVISALKITFFYMASLQDGNFVCVNYSVLSRNVVLEVNAHDGLRMVNLLCLMTIVSFFVTWRSTI